MRWPALLLLAYVVVGVQVGAGAFAAVGGAGPDVAVLVVAFVGLNAGAATAAFAGLVVGAMQDVASVQPMGEYAFAYGACGYAVARAAGVVRRGNPLTHVAAGAACGAITGVVVLVVGWVRPAGATTVNGQAVVGRVGVGTVALSAVWTAVAAPVVIGLLHRGRRAFGFEGGRRRR